jgi:polyhydroxyalkanoate synthesis repressor PhaR
MNALETRSAASPELHRGVAMGEPRNELRNEPRNELRSDARSDLRVVKKYPNRRLYDTVESRYITLADIRRLVMDKVDFVVIDKKSQEDITRSILLQVIADQEHAGEPLMSQDFLSQVIRSYGGAMQSVVGSYLEQSLKLLSSQQQQMREHMRGIMGNDAFDSIATLTQQNLERWRSVQDDIYKVMCGATHDSGAAGRGKERTEAESEQRS